MTEIRTLPSVGELMTPDPVTVLADAPLSEAIQLFDLYRFHGLPVVDELGTLVGVLSETDLVRARTTEHMWDGWPGLKVRHLMTSPAITAIATTPLDEAVRTMEERHIHRLVVVDEDEEENPIGVLSMTDVVHAMAEAVRDA
jgi:CBS-domain-containing membrane protein